MTHKFLMIVEDDNMVRNMYRMILGKHYPIEDFSGSEPALDRFRQHPGHFGLVLTDNRMPAINDGLRMSEELYRINPVVPVVLCSGTLDDLIGQTIPGNVKKTFQKARFTIQELRDEIARHYLG